MACDDHHIIKDNRMIYTLIYVRVFILGYFFCTAYVNYKYTILNLSTQHYRKCINTRSSALCYGQIRAYFNHNFMLKLVPNFILRLSSCVILSIPKRERKKMVGIY